MNLWVISDTHIPERTRRLPEEFLEKIKDEDIIFHCGDFVCLEVLKELEKKALVYAVSGNMDHLELKSLLPKKRVEQISEIKIGVIHGFGSPFGLAQRVYREFDEKPEVILFGHSHSPFQRKIENTLLFNPGSLSGNLFSWKKSYGVLHIDQDRIWSEVFYI